MTREEIRRRFAAYAPDAARGDHELNADWPVPGTLRQAAVLAPLVARPGGVTVLLTRRSAHLADHAGQIGFPGGRIAGAESAEAAALREAREEIGLAAASVTPIGRLDTYVTRTGFEITPIVALLAPPLDLTPDPNEVAEIFEVPLAFFLDPGNRRIERRSFHGRQRAFYAYPFGAYYIWGATAGMLSNLAEVLGAAGA